jgi:hypothetical protein
MVMDFCLSLKLLCGGTLLVGFLCIQEDVLMEKKLCTFKLDNKSVNFTYKCHWSLYFVTVKMVTDDYFIKFWLSDKYIARQWKSMLSFWNLRSTMDLVLLLTASKIFVTCFTSNL